MDYEEHDIVELTKTIKVEELAGGEVELQEKWLGTIVSDAKTPEPFIEFTLYRERPIMAFVSVEYIKLMTPDWDRHELEEKLWEETSKNPDLVPSPEWHREILEETARRVESDELKSQSWDEAWADIERKCGLRPNPSENP